MRQLAGPVLLLTLLVPALGCDKATPVAPTGTTLVISASPASIPTNTGSSTITVVARKANGTPVNPGTEVRFDTTLGTIDSVATTNSSGVATATLRGDGRFGKATVRATSGVATAVTVDVEVGSAAKTISLQATPTTLAATGGDVKLTALVRNSNGQPAAGVGVNFTTELGRLRSGGAILTTDANGLVRDTLTVSADEIERTSTTGFTVNATTTDGSGGLVSTSFEVKVQTDRPTANFTASSLGKFQVQFQSTSTGQEPLDFEWDFGDPSSADNTSTDRNPRHDYGTAGLFTVTLTVSNAQGFTDVVVKQIQVENGKVTIVGG